MDYLLICIVVGWLGCDVFGEDVFVVIGCEELVVDFVCYGFYGILKVLFYLCGGIDFVSFFDVFDEFCVEMLVFEILEIVIGQFGFFFVFVLGKDVYVGINCLVEVCVCIFEFFCVFLSDVDIVWCKFDGLFEWQC